MFNYLSKITTLLFFIIYFFTFFSPLIAAEAEVPYDDDFCLMCHEDTELESSEGHILYTDTGLLDKSAHKDVACYECHAQGDADFEDFPHFEEYNPVDCNSCHTREAAVWMEYFYKMLEKRGSEDIPDCKECHGDHNAQKQMGMKIVCERCHEGIAAEYRESYHFKKYQEDTRHYPICTTCHDPHFKSKREVMSEIEYKQEIVDICSECHQKDIEKYIHSRHFHEMEGGNTEAPVCTSCHEKHGIKKPSDPNSRVNALHISDVCDDCHAGHKESLHRGTAMDPAMISCASCHTGHQTDMASINHAIFKEGGIFNQCNYCHSSERHAKESLAHGEIMLLDHNGDEANCTKCHVYHANMPHEDGEQVKPRTTECVNCHAQQNREYSNSIHSKARAAGITEAPSCTDCHGERDIKKVSEQFTPEGVVELCSQCHSDKDMMLKLHINPYVTEGYKDTYHGKILEMGSENVQFAVCSNCHGSHSILPPEDPESTVNRGHIVETCKHCHPRANDKFVSYLVHPKSPSNAELEYGLALAEEDEGSGGPRSPGGYVTGQEKYDSINKVVAGAMTMLLVGVLSMFGFHTILWFQRGIRGRFVVKGTYYRRFSGLHTFLHILVNISFLTLAFTGLPQSYAHTDLAKWLFKHFMSLQTAQLLHYIAAAVTGLYFAIHLIELAFKLKKRGFKALFTGSNTMVPRWKDFQDFAAHLKWFVKKGPHPKFDRWTYWEKFDYFAVFWGVAVIGLSGLLRWKDEFFGSILGGGVISLADTIHKEEALLATAFIFIIHFFNTHLRAEKFPMDISIYSGMVSEEDFKEERPLEWERLKANGELESFKVKPMGVFRNIISHFWGTVALLTGLYLLALILIGQFTGH